MSSSTSGRNPERPGGEPVGESGPLDQLEHQGAKAGAFLEAVDGADVRVIERREHPRLTFEAGTSRRIREPLLGQDLDRDVEFRVACAIHLAHAAGSE
jgi:hypothetical protein